MNHTFGIRCSTTGILPKQAEERKTGVTPEQVGYNAWRSKASFSRRTLSLRIHAIATTASLCAVLACSGQPEETRARPADGPVAVDPKPAPSDGERLNTLADEFFDEMLKMDPLLATLIGDQRHDDRLENTIGPEHRKRFLELNDRYLRALQGIDPGALDGRDLLTYEIFKRDRELAIKGASIPDHLLPLNQISSVPDVFARLGSGAGLQPFETVEDYENFLARMDGFVIWMDQAITNMREGARTGIVQPKVIMERTLSRLGLHIVDDVRDALFYRPVLSFPEGIGEDQRARLTVLYESALEEKVVPAYRRVRDYIRDEYMLHARDQVGLGALPGGAQWYAFLIEENTTTTLTPEVIHRVGLNEVKRIHLELRDVQSRAGYAGSMRDFFAHMSSDPGFIFDDAEALLDGYEALRLQAHERVQALFDIAPRSDYEIRAVEPSLETFSAAVSYDPAPADGSSPAILSINTGDLSARPLWAMGSLFLHEAEPGHHLQIGIQRELTELPRFRRLTGIPAFSEGWGLYAESLGRELGIYEDPYQHYGALSADLWRAIRLVVDTGLHHGGWTVDHALGYMVANAAVDEARARAEVERFIAIPGQALTYKTGQIKISTLRTLAERNLGDAFDIKAFHRAVLEDGALPLDVLQRKMERWMASRAGGGARRPD